MSVSKPINKSEFTIRATRINKSQELTGNTLGVTIGQFLSSSFNDDSNYLNNSSYNVYNSLFVNFYSSASYSSTNKFSPYHTITDTRVINPVYLNKFYETGSYISIPQSSYGERIKPGTFVGIPSLTLGTNLNTTAGVTNPDDESTAAGIWINGDGATNNQCINFGQSTDNETVGTYSLRATANTNNDRIHFSFPSVAGERYRIQFDMKITNHHSSNAKVLLRAGTTQNDTTYYNASSWDLYPNTDTNTYTVDLTTGVTTTFFTIRENGGIDNPGVDMYIDNLKINHIGESTTDSNNVSLQIKDDGYGNLYQTNPYHSQSAATSISSSENYIGNIFYDFGLIVLAETASWSGSTDYTDLASKNWSLYFDATQTVYVREYSITLKPKDFNTTMNPMIRGFNSGSSTITKHTDSSVVYTDFTESNWRPYYNQINLYDSKTGEPLIVARLPRPVKVRDNMNITYKIRLDI